MTDGKGETLSHTRMSVARRRLWSVVTDCSVPYCHMYAIGEHFEEQRVIITYCIEKNSDL